MKRNFKSFIFIIKTDIAKGKMSLVAALMRNDLTILFLLMVLLNISSSCKKQIEVEAPSTSLNASNVFTSDATAASVMTGIYTKISASNFSRGGLISMSLFPALSSDELTLFDSLNQSYSPYYKNGLTSTLTSSSTSFSDFWKNIYPIVFSANSVLEGVQKSNSINSGLKEQLIGEALFIRAFCYFYLVNLYGDVPLATATDWKINSSLSRTSKTKVYEQVVNDLKSAQSLLSDNYLMGDALTPYATGLEERVRPTKWAATALLARTYLFLADYADAEIQATAVIENSNKYNLSELSEAFIKNSSETIWSLQPVGTGSASNTGEGKLFILPATGPTKGSYPVFLSSKLVNSFEIGDLRKANWTANITPIPAAITYYYPYKYKVGGVNTSVKEYSIVLRLAEQYLIRAEARAQQNKLSQAIEDVDKIRQRAGLPLVASANPSIDKTDLLSTILHERQVELFTEWGHRWFDIKRTGIVDILMTTISPEKGGLWVTTSQLYPVPLSELTNAPQLVQNPGY